MPLAQRQIITEQCLKKTLVFSASISLNPFWIIYVSKRQPNLIKWSFSELILTLNDGEFRGKGCNLQFTLIILHRKWNFRIAPLHRCGNLVAIKSRKKMRRFEMIRDLQDKWNIFSLSMKWKSFVFVEKFGVESSVYKKKQFNDFRFSN